MLIVKRPLVVVGSGARWCWTSQYLERVKESPLYPAENIGIDVQEGA